jgi:hypothetical protein
MNELDLKRLWKENHDKLEGSFSFNKEYADNTTRMKVQSMQGSMKPVKFFTLLVGILWVGIGSIALISVYLHSFSEANKPLVLTNTGTSPAPANARPDPAHVPLAQICNGICISKITPG